MKVSQIVLAVAGAVAAIFALTWLAQGNDFFLYKVFAPKYEEARRETFEESKAYNDGMAQELLQLQLDYPRAANQSEKDAIASVVLHKTAGYDASRLSSDLQAFVRQVKADRGVAQ
jgi:hypothetical protein